MGIVTRDRFRPLLVLVFAMLAFPAIACLGSSTGSEIASEISPATKAATPKSAPVQSSAQSRSSAPSQSPAPAEQPAAAPVPAPLPSPPPPQDRGANENAFSIVRVAQIVRPAVVNITTQQIAFDFNLRPVPEEAGAGSGVIFDKAGYILTNNHVVEDAQGLKVTLPDGRTFDGTLVGADPRTDLAVVRIEGKDLPTAALGDSDALQIGEPVVAIGNALALRGGPTVTSGIVGALARTIREDNGALLYDLVQTDAAINPGNSGGPLVNLAAQVVGINTAIANAPAGGIGFAISINAARPIAEQLISEGHVTRPWLGVSMQTVTPSIATRNRLPVSTGVMITQVQRGTPAARAGMRAGDIVIRFGDEQTDDDAALLRALSKRKIGETVPVTVVRGAERITLNVTLERMP